MKLIQVETKEMLDELYKESALTFIGMRTDTDNIYAIINWINSYTKLKNEDIYIIKGDLMNRIYGLTGDNSYQDNLNIVSIKLSDMEDSKKIVVPRFSVGGRWFDDIVDNNARHQKGLM